MKFIDKLERKFGRFGVPNLTVYIIGCYVLGYFLAMFAPGVLNMLSLDMSMVMKGQIWRLVTWVIYPPSSVGGTGNLVMFLLAIFFFYYPIGTSLERTWGTFRFNVYIFGGMIFTVIGAFVLYGIYYAMNASVISQMPALAAQLSYSIASGFSTNYINMSIFLAFAVMYPDMQVMLYFIIPIKMKWMAIVYAILTLYEFIVSGWAGRVAIFMSLLNFIIFFFSTRNFKRYSPHEIHRRQQFKSQMRQPRPGSGITKHKCAICGRTELDDPNLEFRFCSKCDGNYEYCQDHLFTHKHIKKG